MELKERAILKTLGRSHSKIKYIGRLFLGSDQMEHQSVVQHYISRPQPHILSPSSFSSFVYFDSFCFPVERQIVICQFIVTQRLQLKLVLYTTVVPETEQSQLGSKHKP